MAILFSSIWASLVIQVLRFLLSHQLISGTQALNDGAVDLNEGMIRFDEEGISELTDLFGDEVEEAVDRIHATMDAGKNYKTFTKFPEGMEGDVKFIIKTDEVKKNN